MRLKYYEVNDFNKIIDKIQRAKEERFRINHQKQNILISPLAKIAFK